MRRLVLKNLALAGALVLGVAQPTMAQEFPKKQPIKIVVGANAGGGTDVLARVTADFLQKRLGQAVVVENKAGAGGSIAVDFVSKSPADGYTLLFMASELVVLPAVRSNLPYKFEDLTYLVGAFSFQPLLLGSPKFPVSNAAELITYMKANPGKVRYGSTGVGAIVHMGIAALEGAAGVKGTHVPYTGIAPVYTDMLAGTVEITEATPPFAEGLKVLGTVGPKRNPSYPNIPTLEESGIKGASWDILFGFMAPPNTPKPIADRLIAEITAVLKDPEAIAKYQSAAKTSPDASPLTGEAFKKRSLDDHKSWKAIVEREKIVVQQ